MHLYDVIDRPLVTEKSQSMMESNQYFFVVRKNATKPMVKKAVEALIDVKVVAVNIILQKGKKKVFRGHIGQRSDFKKAMVRIEPGKTIDLGMGS